MHRDKQEKVVINLIFNIIRVGGGYLTLLGGRKGMVQNNVILS